MCLRGDGSALPVASAPAAGLSPPALCSHVPSACSLAFELVQLGGQVAWSPDWVSFSILGPSKRALASQVARVIMSPPARQETPLRSLGQEDPLEEQIATHFSIPAWEIPWTEEPGGVKSTRLQRVGHD